MRALEAAASSAQLAATQEQHRLALQLQELNLRCEHLQVRGPPSYSDVKVANRTNRVRHRAT